MLWAAMRGRTKTRLKDFKPLEIENGILISGGDPMSDENLQSTSHVFLPQ